MSIFEQRHFIDDKKITKEFKHDLDIEEIKVTTNILHFAGTNPEERKKIENEQEAWRTITAFTEDTENKLMKAIEAINEKDKVIDEKDKVIDEKDKALNELKKELEELKKKTLGNL